MRRGEPPELTKSPIDAVRRRAVVCLLVLPVLLQLPYGFASLDERWPFSNFMMFSRLRSPTRNTRAIVVLGEDVTGRTHRIDSPRFAAPFNLVLLKATLKGRSRQRRLKLGPLLKLWAEAYEQNRSTGRHDRPPLRAIVLVRRHWDWSGGLDNPTTEDVVINRLAL